jgi:hypothetical protein
VTALLYVLGVLAYFVVGAFVIALMARRERAWRDEQDMLAGLIIMWPLLATMVIGEVLVALARKLISRNE